MTESNAIKKYEEQAPRVVEMATRVEIRCDADYQEAAGIAGQIKSAIGEIEDTRTGITKPMREALNQANAFFKRVSGPFEEAEKILKQKLAQYGQEAREREAKALQAAASAGTHEALIAVAATIGHSAPVASNVQSRTYYEFEITDRDAIPEEFWAVDEKALGAYVRATKGSKEVPGVRVIVRKDVAVGKI
jgi:hypothetical protein